MIKNILRRFLSLALSAVMVMALLPAVSTTALAATSGDLTGLSNGDIGASYTATDDGSNASWSANGNGIIGSVISTSGACGGSTNYETTLTITNNKSAAATLSFEYTIAQSSGTIQVAGTAVTAGGSYSSELAAGGSIKIYLKSGSTNAATSITITNLNLLADAEATTTFRPAENGSYTVDGDAITAETSRTKDSSEAYTLAATPASGYKFMGWYSVTESKYVSSDASATLSFDSDQTITAMFTKESDPVFEVSGVKFTDLNEANTYASTNSLSKITLVSDGTLSRGNYTISSGNTLLIPFDEAYTCYTTEPQHTKNNWTQPKAFKKMIMAEGASITVENGGTISISAKHHANGNQGIPSCYGCGAPTGPYGYIFMQGGSEITINSGGALYVWGYLSGDGIVTAKSGAKVYENMQIQDYRGGTATTFLKTKAKGKAFFFTQYYIQNIEAKLILESGADEYLYTSLFMKQGDMEQTASTMIHFIGSSGMFTVSSGGTFTKQYIPEKDRLEMTIAGNATVNNLSLSLMSVDVDSKEYVLPISNSITIKVASGTTTITQDMALLPGVQVEVANGAQLKTTENSKVYVYDWNEWKGKNFTFNSTSSNFKGNFRPTSYSPTRTYDRKDADLPDMKLDINGTLEIGGYLYTTESGANICSSKGTGVVTLAQGAGTATKTYQVVNAEHDVTEISITSAKLHNGEKHKGTEEEYTLTDGAAAGDTYQYCEYCKKWYKVGEHDTVKLYVNDSETAVTSCSSTASVKFSDQEKPIKCDHAYEYADGTLTITDLTGGETEVHVWTKAVAQIIGADGSVGLYVSLQDAVNDYDSTGYIQMVAESKEPGFTISKKVVYLDLNGMTVTLTGADNSVGTLAIADGAALYGMDNETNGYVDTAYGKIIGTVSGNVALTYQTPAAADGTFQRYVKFEDTANNALSFHRYNISVSGYRFDFNENNTSALYFQGTFSGSDTVKQLLRDVGFDVDGTRVWWTAENTLNALAGEKYEIQVALVGNFTTDELKAPHMVYAMADFMGDQANPAMSDQKTLSFWEVLQKHYEKLKAKVDRSPEEEADLAILERVLNGAQTAAAQETAD